MKLKKIIFSIVTIQLCLTIGLAQNKDNEKEKNDFSGTWIYEHSVSPKELGSKIYTAKSDLKWVIVQSETEVKMSGFATNLKGEQETREVIYYTDGRGETRQSYYPIETPFSGQLRGQPSKLEKLKSKSKWDGNKLVSRAVVAKIIKGQFLNVEVVDEWELSNDGKKLIYRGTQSVLTSEMAKIMAANEGRDVRNPGVASPTKFVMVKVENVYKRIEETNVK